MEGSAKVLITAIGIHSQTGIIMSLLGTTDNDARDEDEKKKKEGKECRKGKFRDNKTKQKYKA